MAYDLPPADFLDSSYKMVSNIMYLLRYPLIMSTGIPYK